MKKKRVIQSLIILSIITGILWRVEIEYHGWTGLIWLSYFHFAIPIGFCLFLVWANFIINLNLQKRILINFIAIIYGAFIYYGLLISLTYIYTCGPSGFLLAIQISEWKLNLLRYSIFLIIPFIPIGSYIILKLFRTEPHFKFLVMAIAGFIIAIPVSDLILDITNHKGGHDFLHSIKSGALLPFWTFSAGLLIVGQKTK